MAPPLFFHSYLPYQLFVDSVHLSPGQHTAFASHLKDMVMLNKQSLNIALPMNKFMVLKTKCDLTSRGFSYGGASLKIIFVCISVHPLHQMSTHM